MVVIGALLLGEVITLKQFMGIALVFGGIAGGVVLFLLLTGVLAGISIGNPGPPKYELVEDPSIDPAAQTDFLDKPAATASTASPAAAHDEEWPASLP